MCQLPGRKANPFPSIPNESSLHKRQIMITQGSKFNDDKVVQTITPDTKPRRHINMIRELVAERIVSIETKYEKIISNLKSDHAEVVANLKDDHADVLTKLKADHVDVLAKLEADHVEAIYKLKKTNQGLKLQRSRVKKKHDAVVKKMAKHKECAENTRTQFVDELSAKEKKFKRKLEAAAESVCIANKKVSVSARSVSGLECEGRECEELECKC